MAAWVHYVRNISCFNMLGYYYILFVLVVAVVNAEDEDFEKCMVLFEEENIKAMCCENMNGFLNIDHHNECKDKKDMCEKSNCVLELMGVKIENNKIDEASASQVMDKLSEDYPEAMKMIERTKKSCMDGKYEDYASSVETCNSMKLHICAYVNSMVECDKWKNDETCQKVESAAKECKKSLDNSST